MAKIQKISTIAEKIKKNQINVSNIKKFSSINYYERKELISPYLHNIDSDILLDMVDFNIKYRFDKTVFEKLKTEINIHNDISLKNEIFDVFTNIPDELIKDIYNQLYNKSNKLDYKKRDNLNKNKYNILDKANDSIIKILSENSNIKSSIFTNKVMEYIIYTLLVLKHKDRDAYQNIVDSLNNQKSSNNNQQQDSNNNSNNANNNQSNNVDDSDDDSLDNNQNNNNQNNNTNNTNSGNSVSKVDVLEKELNKNNNIFNDLIDKGKNIIENLNTLYNEDELNDLWSDESDILTNEIENIENLSKKIEKIQVRSSNIKKHIQKILDKSLSYFSINEIVKYDNFLDDPSISDILDYTYLHQNLRKVLIDDVQIKNSKKVGKVDIYIDVSGSMDCSACIEDDHTITRLDFTKAFLLELKKINIINNIYTFDTRVKKFNYDKIRVLRLNTGGGTNLEKVIREIKDNDKNSIVITDCEDHLDIYDKKAFIIGVAGSRFDMFNPKTIEEYSTNNQILYFDGINVLKIDKRGNPTK